MAVRQERAVKSRKERMRKPNRSPFQRQRTPYAVFPAPRLTMSISWNGASRAATLSTDATAKL
jgi:hypothetical protein